CIRRAADRDRRSPAVEPDGRRAWPNELRPARWCPGGWYAPSRFPRRPCSLRLRCGRGRASRGRNALLRRPVRLGGGRRSRTPPAELGRATRGGEAVAPLLVAPPSVAAAVLRR